MTPIELPANRTPLTYADLCNAFLLAFEVTGEQVTRAITRLGVAQMGIEANGGRSCMENNISGIKARPGGMYCWQYFTTAEWFDATWLAKAQSEAAKLGNPTLVNILETKNGKTKVMLAPKHPYCCFRAYPNLIRSEDIPTKDRVSSAMIDHLLTMQQHFPHGFAGLLAADIDRFAHGLKQDGWYTAPELQYENGLHYRLAEELRAVTDEWDGWGDVPEGAP